MTDAGLLKAAAAGSHAAFAEIASRHYQPVYRLAWRMTNGAADAEDMAQEAFVKLWKNPSQVREAGALKGWLMPLISTCRPIAKAKSRAAQPCSAVIGARNRPKLWRNPMASMAPQTAQPITSAIGRAREREGAACDMRPPCHFTPFKRNPRLRG